MKSVAVLWACIGVIVNTQHLAPDDAEVLHILYMCTHIECSHICFLSICIQSSTIADLGNAVASMAPIGTKLVPILTFQQWDLGQL